MTDLLTRIQNWYKTNCNGNWEHSYGLSITTLDNPGWALNIDLNGTALENLYFNRKYQDKEKEHDWFFIKVEDKVLVISCGPGNLSQVFSIFLDEIIPAYSDPNYLYDIYLPVSGYKHKIWTLAKGKIIKEDTLEIVEIPSIILKEIKVQDLDHLDFTENEIINFSSIFKVGDQVLTGIEEMFDGVKLVAKQK